MGTRGMGDSPTEVYAAYRRHLLQTGLAPAAAIVFALTLLYELADLIFSPTVFYAEILPNLIQLLIPLITLLLARGPLRRHIEFLAAGADLAYTAVLAARLLLPTTTVSGTALFLSLKMVGTAVLFPWHAYAQYVSATGTLLLYWSMLALSGNAMAAMHQLLGPLIAAILSAVGAVRSDRTRQALLRRSLKLSESGKQLHSMLSGERSLVAIAREISVLADLPTLLERINRRTAAVLDCDFSTTFLVDDDRREFMTISTHSDARDLRGPVQAYRGSIDTPMVQEVLRGQTVVINDTGKQPWIAPTLLAQFDVRSVVFTPIIAKERVVGILSAGRRKRVVEFHKRQIALLKGIAAQAAIAIENARLFENLAASEARYRDLFQRANDLIFVVHENGTFQFANQAALDFAGVDTPRVDHLRWQQFLTAAEETRLQRRIALARRRTLDHTRAFEVEACPPGGRTATLEVRARLISRPGESRVYQCIARDVTERRRQEIETRRLLHQLQESNRLQSEFVANMSHELRTPLNVIIGYADMLADEPDLRLGTNARSFVDRVGAAGRALFRLVESVLQYARLDRGRSIFLPTRFSANQLLLELQSLCNDLRTSPDVNLRVDRAPDIEFHTDYDRLYSVLSNLLLNALKFTPRGEVQLSFQRLERDAEFCVRDTGIGIPEEQLNHVFEPFRQVDGSPTRNFGGVGLGLAIVRRNVDLLGGSVEVESHVGVGSTFRVRVPLDLNPQSSQVNASSAA